jgi:hypothetical protein
MKYFAILKDSFREAIDTKVMYFTLGLSILVVALIGSVRFRLVTAEEQFTRAAGTLNWVLGMAMPGKAPHYAVEDFKKLNPSGQPWESNYSFTYVIELPDEKSVEEAKRAGLVPTANQLHEQFGRIPWVEQIEVNEAKTEKPTEFRYRIETKGSKATDRRAWTHEPQLFFGAVPLTWFQGRLDHQVEFITDWLIGTFGAAIMMLLSTVITAFFIPNMLRKGAVDLMLAKPIHRTTLLVYKFIGGLTFMFLNTVVIMSGIWLVLGLQSHLWVNGLLLCIGIYTFQFAIFYAVSTLMAVLTRSPVVAILTASVLWGLLLLIGYGYRAIDALRPEKLEARMPFKKKVIDVDEKQGSEDPNAPPEIRALPRWVYVTVDVIHFVTPHYKDLDKLTTKLIRSDLIDPAGKEREALDKEVGSINWTESLSVTVTFIAVMLGLACWRFATKDY